MRTGGLFQFMRFVCNLPRIMRLFDFVRNYAKNYASIICQGLAVDDGAGSDSDSEGEGELSEGESECECVRVSRDCVRPSRNNKSSVYNH